MPLLNPGKREDEEKPPPTEAQMFVQNTVRKGQGFWSAIGQMAHKARSLRMPDGMKQLGRDIWYGTTPKKKPDTRPLHRWKWLWGSYKPKPRTLSKPYVAFQGLGLDRTRKRKR